MNRRTLLIAASSAMLISAAIVMALRSDAPVSSGAIVHETADEFMQPVAAPASPPGEIPVIPTETFTATEPIDAPPVEDATAEEPSLSCVRWEDLTSDPLYDEEMARLQPVAVFGKDYEVFLDVSKPDLRSFAEQGDSAAMVLYGAYLSAEAQ
ncbi:MAG: hypothetical protein AAFQ99_02665, partial [Pseudomonadota bacterium]